MKIETTSDRLINHIASGNIKALQNEIANQGGMPIEVFEAVYNYLCEPENTDTPFYANNYYDLLQEVQKGETEGWHLVSDEALNRVVRIIDCYDEMKKDNTLYLLKKCLDK